MKQEYEGLTFKPSVCKTSDIIVRQKESYRFDSADSRKNKYAKFDNLYADACRRQERQNFIYNNCIEAECTFQPDTEKTKYVNYKLASMKSNGTSDVFERLSHRMNNSYDRSKLLMEHSKNLTNDLFDPETGQEYFKPKVGRAPRGRRDYKPGVDLYNQAYQSRERKES